MFRFGDGLKASYNWHLLCNILYSSNGVKIHFLLFLSFISDR